MATIPVSIQNATLSRSDFWKLRERDEAKWRLALWNANKTRHMESIHRVARSLWDFVLSYRRLPSIRDLERFAGTCHKTIEKMLDDQLFISYMEKCVKYLASVGSVFLKSVLYSKYCSYMCSNTHSSKQNTPPTPVKKQEDGTLDPEKLRDLVEKSKKPPQESHWDRLQRLLGVNKGPPK